MNAELTIFFKFHVKRTRSDADKNTFSKNRSLPDPHCRQSYMENSEPGVIPGRYRRCIRKRMYEHNNPFTSLVDESQSLGNREGKAWIENPLNMRKSEDLLEANPCPRCMEPGSFCCGKTAATANMLSQFFIL